MAFLRTPKKIHWTNHAREKMGYYRLSEARVRRVMNAPQRIEEGVAPKTVAMMQPISTSSSRTEIVPGKRRGFGGAALFTSSSSKQNDNGKAKPAWSQEIWVMVQDVPTGRKIISAWRYPGVSKVRGEIKDMMQNEYQSYLSKP